jgi:hypothetical protein
MAAIVAAEFAKLPEPERLYPFHVDCGCNALR